MNLIADRLKSLDITLPEAVAPVANYVPFVITGNLVIISGQLSVGPDGLIAGTVGKDISVADAAAAARICGLNVLAHLNIACGTRGITLDGVTRVVRLGGFVTADAGFTDHPAVINGASDLMVEVFGEAGRHARAAVGVTGLPLGAAVEVDAIFEIG